MKKPLDANCLIGHQFAFLKVINKLPKIDPKKGQLWECKCRCGNIITMSTRRLNQRIPKSCGCVRLGKGCGGSDDPFESFPIVFDKIK